MSAVQDPQDPQELTLAAHTRGQQRGDQSATVENNSGIISFGDHAVNVLFAEGASAEGALVELVDRLVRAVSAEPRSVDDELKVVPHGV